MVKINFDVNQFYLKLTEHSEWQYFISATLALIAQYKIIDDPEEAVIKCSMRSATSL